MSALALVVPDRPPDQPSGGDRYDAEILARWRHLGREVSEVRVAGGWPWPTAEELAALGRALDTLGDDVVVLLDGLVGCAAPEEVRASASRRRTGLLIHSLLADGAGATGDEAVELDRLERRALAAADTVVAVSAWAREELRARHGVQEVAVARPGTERAPLAAGSGGAVPGTGAAGPLLLSLGAVAPLKNHGLLLAALGHVADLRWTAVVAGPAPDAAYLEQLVDDARARGIGDRVSWPGAVLGEALERLWHRTDLLVHPSRSEAWGQVVAQAYAHGIPTVVGAGTGAVEALTHGAGPAPGAAVPTDDPEELAAALRAWLTDADLRRRWRAAAVARRNLLDGWDRTVEQIDAALGRRPA